MALDFFLIFLYIHETKAKKLMTRIHFHSCRFLFESTSHFAKMEGSKRKLLRNFKSHKILQVSFPLFFWNLKKRHEKFFYECNFVHVQTKLNYKVLSVCQQIKGLILAVVAYQTSLKKGFSYPKQNLV